MAKKLQFIMVWFLPLIVIGGFFYPLLGYLVVAMMAFFLTLSFFKGRYWCWHLCPRGAFLDIIISKLSFNRPLPGIFLKQWFRWLIFFLFLSFLAFRVTKAGASLIAIGIIFIITCLVTTIISVILGISLKHRSWCAICPMGTLQEKIGKIHQFKVKSQPK
ncbi:MAG: 4Fe-4S binding protein [Candidatus Omnitrophota bacterium]|jgi:polyferredoxin|nr:MAG: 4Fe-4S binding protein [Candidatus Omnitrophota bacterium]